MTFSFRRRWVLILSAIALGVIAVLSVRTKRDDAPITIESSKPLVDAPVATPSGEQFSVTRLDVTSTKAQAGPSTGGHVPDALTARSTLLAEASLPAGRPLDIRVTAPIQAAHGSTFEVSVGFPDRAHVRSAKFRVSYDVDSLEVLNIIDATGTELMVVPSGDGSVELEFDTEQGAIQAPAIRFLARVDAAHLVRITVTADAWDATGKALAIAPLAPFPIMLVP